MKSERKNEKKRLNQIKKQKSDDFLFGLIRFFFL